jgi:hypothetical protein
MLTLWNRMMDVVHCYLKIDSSVVMFGCDVLMFRWIVCCFVHYPPCSFKKDTGALRISTSKEKYPINL